MSERTTIGGTVYEVVGSSSSNLLLKCNGTARIQWGNKLIDLIKNGKIASNDSSINISIISDESEIKFDGIYILNNDNTPQLLVRKNGEIYNLNRTDLYISASTKQDITVEQKNQALENIGIYYNTMSELENAGIQNGIVYVLEDNNLYTIKNGIISEFEAKLKTVTVEKENEEGETINSSIKIILSVLDDQYLILEDRKITANYSIHVNNSAQLGSENADSNKGYRLYISGGVSKLDVDEINVRNGISYSDYIETTYSDLMYLRDFGLLKPHSWYLIKDFQNHWKLPINDIKHDRPILVRSLTTKTFYEEGQLFKDRRVTIKYDPDYTPVITCVNNLGNATDTTVYARGRITWMKDANNNEANFDFLDYTDAFKNPLTTLHDSTESDELDSSIFPKGSYNNKLTVFDLKGTVIVDGLIDNSNVTTIDFKIDDSTSPDEEKPKSTMIMHDNVIECRGFTVEETCTNFCGNVIEKSCSVIVSTPTLLNNTLSNIYYTKDKSEITDFLKITNNTIFIPITLSVKLVNVVWEGLINSTIKAALNNNTFGIIKNSTINATIQGSTFENIESSTLSCKFNKSNFKSLKNCVFNSGYVEGIIQNVIENVTCHEDLENFAITPQEYTSLYDITKAKDVYTYTNADGQQDLQIIIGQELSFARGMIVMHYGQSPIPIGWAPCDGKEHTFNGVTTITPNLVDKFIKGTDDYTKEKDTVIHDDNKLVLTTSHLPKHNHPHKEHTHIFSGSAEISAFNEYTKADVEVGNGTKKYFVDNLSSASNQVEISGITGASISEEADWQYLEKPEAIQIEPNYFSLIFIMKL